VLEQRDIAVADGKVAHADDRLGIIHPQISST
jgi:hypothetical protein